MLYNNAIPMGFLSELEKRVLVFDGAMGTMIQQQKLASLDFDGHDGCNEILNVTKPDIITSIHRAYLAAGADVIETNTFGANAMNLSEYGLESRVYELNKSAAEIAKKAAAEFTGRFVAGSIGPGTKSPSRGEITFESLEKTYYEQVAGLIDGGADIMLVETCYDLLQTKAALAAIQKYFVDSHKRLPVMAQVTIEQTGRMLLGTEIEAVAATLEPYDIDVLGLNCATGPENMNDALRYLSMHWKKAISCQPNAGLPKIENGNMAYDLQPLEFVASLRRYVKEYGLNVVGGCCGTTPEFIALLAKTIAMEQPKVRSIVHQPSIASMFSATTIEQDPKPLIIGEKMNATTQNKEFKQLVTNEEYDKILDFARHQAEGAHALDLCVDIAGGKKPASYYLENIVSRLAPILSVPLVLDSDAPENVVEYGLKHIPGRAVINSVNLEDGGKRMDAIFSLAKKYGAAVIALSIDENGMALTADRKVAVAKRICESAVHHGLRPQDMLFDVLTLPISTGQEEYKTAAVETLEAIKRIRHEIPGAYTVLGISNISFGLKQHGRRVLNSVFLHEAVNAGLDAALVNAMKIYPMQQLPQKEIELARALIYHQKVDGLEPLEAFLSYFDNATAPEMHADNEEHTLEDALKNCIIKGEKEIRLGKARAPLSFILDEALKKYNALEIINTYLLNAMRTVGKLFNAGRLQLPFVLRSAEVMKAAVSYLEPFIETAKGSTSKGTIVLATVKGDVHDIGKNLVDIILSNNGYTVNNLGIKQSSDAIIKAASETKADAVGLSGLLVKSMLEMKNILEDMELRGMSLPVICGGAALQRNYVESELRSAYSGPVYYALDAFEGLKILDELTNTKTRDAKILDGKRIAQIKGYPEHPANSEEAVRKDVAIPTPLFYGTRIISATAEEIYPYINTTALFRGQWGYRQRALSAAEYECLLKSWVYPLFEQMKNEYRTILQPKAVYGYFACKSCGDDLVIYDNNGQELERFAFPRQRHGKKLSISDFFSADKMDVIGIAAVTAGPLVKEEMNLLKCNNGYERYLYLHGLAVESAEAMAEYTHRKMREEMGIANEDGARIEDLFHQKYRGCRYSFGYPACPNLEDQVKLFRLLHPEQIGISLTETFQMVPEESTSAIIVHHPQARYFSV